MITRVSRQQHPLFYRYPLSGQVELDGQPVMTPYHVYDGTMLFIGGTADAGAVQKLLLPERLTPILDEDGKALMALWMCDFTEASLGAHHELQISFFAASSPQPPVRAHPFAIFRLLTLNLAAVMVCHRLWNNLPQVVSYNRKLLGLDASLAISYLDTESIRERRRFRVQDAALHQPVAEGDLHEPAQQDNRTLMNLLTHLGWLGFLRAMRAPFVQVPVVNTIGEVLPDNRIAQTYTRLDRQIIRQYEPDNDQLTIQHPAYAAVNFRPEFVQHGYGVRFVYLNPEQPGR
jgi:hypothetical protein